MVETQIYLPAHLKVPRVKPTSCKSALVQEYVSAFHSTGKEAEPVVMKTKLVPLAAGADRTKVGLIGAGLRCRVL